MPPSTPDHPTPEEYSISNLFPPRHPLPFPLSLANCLAEAARLPGNSQDPACLWAVREGVARLGPSTCHVLRRTLKDRTCVSCGWSLPGPSYILSEITSPGNPFDYRHHRCINCAAELLVAEGVPGLPMSLHTHWYPAMMEPVNLGLDPADRAEVQRRRSQQQQETPSMRDALALLVWSIESRDAALVLGISEVALGKYCGKYEVPKPRSGFWRKVLWRHPVDDLVPPEVGLLLSRFGWRGNHCDWLERLPWSWRFQWPSVSEVLEAVFPGQPYTVMQIAYLIEEYMDAG